MARAPLGIGQLAQEPLQHQPITQLVFGVHAVEEGKRAAIATELRAQDVVLRAMRVFERNLATDRNHLTIEDAIQLVLGDSSGLEQALFVRCATDKVHCC